MSWMGRPTFSRARNVGVSWRPLCETWDPADKHRQRENWDGTVVRFARASANYRLVSTFPMGGQDADERELMTNCQSSGRTSVGWWNAGVEPTHVFKARRHGQSPIATRHAPTFAFRERLWIGTPLPPLSDARWPDSTRLRDHGFYRFRTTNSSITSPEDCAGGRRPNNAVIVGAMSTIWWATCV